VTQTLVLAASPVAASGASTDHDHIGLVISMLGKQPAALSGFDGGSSNSVKRRCAERPGDAVLRKSPGKDFFGFRFLLSMEGLRFKPF
jgi:hypothetical protein